MKVNIEWEPLGTQPAQKLILFTDGNFVFPGWFDSSRGEWPWVFIESAKFYVSGCCDNESEDLVETNAFRIDSVKGWSELPSA